MSILYFDCLAGVSASMVVGAFLDMGVGAAALLSELQKLGISEEYEVEIYRKELSGRAATRFEVRGTVPARRRTLAEASSLVSNALSPGAAANALRILRTFARAESAVGGCTADSRGFFGAGTADALVLVAAASICLELLSPRTVVCSPLAEGSRFASSISPVASGILAEYGAPVVLTFEQEELITPLGAAIVCAVANRFGEMPAMTVRSIGYGAGTRGLLGRPNVLRLILGGTQSIYFEETVSIVRTEVTSAKYNPFAKTRG